MRTPPARRLGVNRTFAELHAVMAVGRAVGSGCRRRTAPGRPYTNQRYDGRGPLRPLCQPDPGAFALGRPLLSKSPVVGYILGWVQPRDPSCNRTNAAKSDSQAPWRIAGGQDDLLPYIHGQLQGQAAVATGCQRVKQPKHEPRYFLRAVRFADEQHIALFCQREDCSSRRPGE